MLNIEQFVITKNRTRVYVIRKSLPLFYQSYYIMDIFGYVLDVLHLLVIMNNHLHFSSYSEQIRSITDVLSRFTAQVHSFQRY